MPALASSRPRNVTMSGSSSTTRIRNAACEAACLPAAARSLIRDFDLRKVFGVALDARLERRAIAAARAILDFLADDRDAGEAVGIADALHAVSELAQLVEVRRRERRAQGIDFLVAVLEERRDEI